MLLGREGMLWSPTCYKETFQHASRRLVKIYWRTGLLRPWLHGSYELFHEMEVLPSRWFGIAVRNTSAALRSNERSTRTRDVVRELQIPTNLSHRNWRQNSPSSVFTIPANMIFGCASRLRDQSFPRQFQQQWTYGGLATYAGQHIHRLNLAGFRSFIDGMTHVPWTTAVKSISWGRGQDQFDSEL